jgi:hypothetical protein
MLMPNVGSWTVVAGSTPMNPSSSCAAEIEHESHRAEISPIRQKRLAMR